MAFHSITNLHKLVQLPLIPTQSCNDPSQLIVERNRLEEIAVGSITQGLDRRRHGITPYYPVDDTLMMGNIIGRRHDELRIATVFELCGYAKPIKLTTLHAEETGRNLIVSHPWRYHGNACIEKHRLFVFNQVDYLVRVIVELLYTREYQCLLYREVRLFLYRFHSLMGLRH